VNRKGEKNRRIKGLEKQPLITEARVRSEKQAPSRKTRQSSTALRGRNALKRGADENHNGRKEE